MRHKLTLILIAGLAAGIFLVRGNYVTLPGNTNQFVRQSTDSIGSQLNDSWHRLTMVLNGKGQGIDLSKMPHFDSNNSGNTTKSRSSSTPLQDPDATPTEPIVVGMHLSNVYYYHFQTGLPAQARQLFQTAVDHYNATGIVQLRPGDATGTQNSVAFGYYHKNNGSQSEQGVIELGHGGPQIIQRFGLQNQTYNHASASFNLTYPQSLSLSVAVHELGHALGLDHSSDPNSVMYPVDQGRSNLTANDLAGLRDIYAHN